MLTLQNTSDQLIHLIIDGEIKKQDIDHAATLMKEKIDQYDKVRMLIEVKDLEGYDSVAAFIKDSRETFQHYGAFEKIAIVSDEQWLSGLTGLADLINPATIKQFCPLEKAIAQEWIKQ